LSRRPALVTRYCTVASALACALVGAFAVPPASAVELANDSFGAGQLPVFEGQFLDGEIAAVRLVPPAPLQLDGVRFLFGSTAITVNVVLHVWDDSAGTVAPGAELLTGTYLVSGSNGTFHWIDVSGAGLVLSGPFRVGLEFTRNGLPCVARDDDGITPGVNFVDLVGIGWQNAADAGVTGDFVIRATLPEPGAAAGAAAALLALVLRGRAARTTKNRPNRRRAGDAYPEP
jgi:hypothetical protein